jgi:hypothetical protein
MTTLNIKSLTSAVAALALTAIMSWTFVDATSVVRNYAPTAQMLASASISALVR